MEDGSPYPVGPSLRHVKVDMATALNSPRGGKAAADPPVVQPSLVGTQVEAPVARTPEGAEHTLNGIGSSREARHGKNQERWEGIESVRTWDGSDEAMLGGSVRTVETLLRGTLDNSTRTVDTAAFKTNAEDAEQRPNNETIDSSGLPCMGSMDDIRPPQQGMTALEHVDLTDIRDGCPHPSPKEKTRTFDTVCEADIADEAFGDGCAETLLAHNAEYPQDANGSARTDGERADTNLGTPHSSGVGFSSFDDATLAPLLAGKKQVQSPLDRCVVIARASISCAVLLGAVLALFLTSGIPFAGHVNSTSTAVPLEPTKGPIDRITTTVRQIDRGHAVNSESSAPQASKTLSLALEVKKLNAQRLMMNDELSSAFKSAVSAAIAAVGGHGLRSEDVLPELAASPSGDVRAHAMVNIPSKMSKHALVQRLSRQQLNVALESKLYVAGFHKVAAGGIFVKVAEGDASLDAVKAPILVPVATTPSVQPASAGGAQTPTTQAAVASPAATVAPATLTPTSPVTPALVSEDLHTASPSHTSATKMPTATSGDLAKPATTVPTASTLPASSSKKIPTTTLNQRPATQVAKATSGEVDTAAMETPAATALPASGKEGLRVAATSPTRATPLDPAALAATPAAAQAARISPPVQPTLQAASWLDEYKKRLKGQGQTLAVQVSLSGGLDTSTLTKLQLHDLSSAMTAELSKAMAINVSDIHNLEGVHGQLSVTTSRWGVTLTANGRIGLPMNVGIQDAVPVLTSEHVRQRLAAAMSELPTLQGAISRAGSIGSFTVSAGQSSEDLFSKLDKNLNKVLDVQEFSMAAWNLLTPPLKNNEIAEVYQKLDVNHDGQLDADEFFGRFSTGKFKLQKDPT